MMPASISPTTRGCPMRPTARPTSRAVTRMPAIWERRRRMSGIRSVAAPHSAGSAPPRSRSAGTRGTRRRASVASSRLTRPSRRAWRVMRMVSPPGQATWRGVVAGRDHPLGREVRAQERATQGDLPSRSQSDDDLPARLGHGHRGIIAAEQVGIAGERRWVPSARWRRSRGSPWAPRSPGPPEGHRRGLRGGCRRRRDRRARVAWALKLGRTGCRRQ